MTLSGVSSNAQLGTATATGRIEDNDPEPTLSVDDFAGAEGQGFLTFPVDISATSTKTVTVDWAASVEPGDTATSGTDFTADSGTLTFNPGNIRVLATVTTIDDSTIEDDETFTVTLSNATNAGISDATATGTIENDDAAGTMPTLSVADAEGNEAAGVEFTVTLSATSTQAVTATWTASIGSGDTAVAADLGATKTGTVTVAMNATTTTFTVPVENDATDEEDETFTVMLSNASNATLSATASTATGTITDDGDLEPTVSVADVSAEEGGGLTFTVTLSAVSGRTVTVGYETSVEADDTAIEDTDYTAASGTLTFAAGQRSRTFTVESIDDSTIEDDETFTVTLSNPMNAEISDATATGTIINDDEARGLAFSPDVLTISDRGVAQNAYTVVLTSEPTATTTVTVTSQSLELLVTNDPVDGPFSDEWDLFFTPDNWDDPQALSLIPVRDYDSVDDRVVLRHEASGGNYEGLIRDYTVTITDMDPRTESIVLSVDPSKVSEGDGPQTLRVTAKLDGGTLTSAATVAVMVSAGTAVTPADFTASTTSFDLTIAPGERSASHTVTLTPVDDALVEGSETVTVSGTTTATIEGTMTTLDVIEAMVTILDDDEPTLSVWNATAPEYDAVEFTVTLSAMSAQAVTVDWATSVEGDDTAISGTDFTATTGTVTVAAGATTTTFRVPVMYDVIDEDDETFTVTLSGATNATLSNEKTTLKVIGTIEDDDNPPEVSFGAASYSVNEGDSVDVTVVLSWASGRPEVVVPLSHAAQGDATAQGADGADYAGVPESVTFEEGETEQKFTIEATADANHPESGEGVALSFGMMPPGAWNETVDEATVTIVDGDDPTPTLSVADDEGAEAAGVEFTVTLSATSTEAVTATWTASIGSGDTADTADLTATTTGIVTVAAGDMTATFTVPVADDATDEADETFTVTLSGVSSNATISATASTATGTITDDDAAVTKPTLGIADAEGAEAAGVEFTVTLSATSTEAVTATWTASIGSGDTADTADLTATTTGIVTVAAGDMTATFTVPVADDATDEADETFTVTLSGVSSNATISATASTATGTITDDDAAVTKPTLGIADAEGAEAAGVEFTVTLSATSTEAVTATWTASIGSGDTADTADLTATTTGIVTVAAGDMTATFTVPVADDATDEADETFTVTLSGVSSNATISATASTATGTITDDDAAVTKPTLGIADAEGAEAAGVEFTVTLSATSTEAVTATWTASIGSGDTADTADLTATTTGIVTVAAGDMTATFTVPVADDATDEADETFTVTLSGVSSNATISATASTATGTITDDDAAVTKPTLGIADAEGAEAAGVEFTVTLSATSTEAVTATWTASIESGDTADLTATTTGIVTVAAGDMTATFTVPVADDATDEADETFTVTLSGVSSNATISATASTATGTITDDDAAVTTRKATQGWIARFGRTVTAQVLEAIEARLRAPRAAGMRATLAGQALPAGDAGGKAVANDNASRGDNASDRVPRADARDREAMTAIGDLVAHAGAGDWRGDRTGGRYRSRTVTGRELLTGTSFALTGGSADSGDFAGVWGRGTLSRFEGRAGALTLDGEVATGLVGVDWAAGPGSGAGRWMAGLAVGHSRGAGRYREDGCMAGSCAGEAEATLTGAWPYAGLVLSDRLSAWAAAGHGAGELRFMPGGNGSPFTADLTMTMGAAGLRGEVLTPPPEGGIALAVKGDARFTRTETEAAKDADGTELEAASADVSLLRAGVEGSRRFALAGDAAGMVLTPSFEVGARLDGGDAETGLGVDLGGGLAFVVPKQGVALDLKARGLIAHEAPGFREWGASASLTWDPRPETGRGLALSLVRSWGGSPSGGMNALFGSETPAGTGADDDAGRLEAELGYGLPTFGGGFTGTPNIGIGLSDTARDYRLGWRLTPARKGAPGFEIGLDATRREATNADAVHGLMLRGTVRW